MQQRSLSITSVQVTDYTTTNVWANVPEFVITVPEDGNYDIFAQCIAKNNAANEGTFIRLAINGNPIIGTISLSTTDAAAIQYDAMSCSKTDVGLKAGDVVSMQSIYNTSSSIIFVSSHGAGSIQIIKRGV